MLKWQSRDDLPAVLNELKLRGLGVEVGTQRGHFAEHIRRQWWGERLYCVDPWKPYPGNPHDQAAHNAMKLEASMRVTRASEWAEKPNGAVLLPFTSIETAAAFADDPKFLLDFVYIDADHEYESVRADILAWLPLIKRGGIIAGHDYVLDGWHRHGQPFEAHATRAAAGEPASLFGVRRAVNEIFRSSSIVLTDANHDDGWQSWMVQV